MKDVHNGCVKGVAVGLPLRRHSLTTSLQTQPHEPLERYLAAHSHSVPGHQLETSQGGVVKGPVDMAGNGHSTASSDRGLTAPLISHWLLSIDLGCPPFQAHPVLISSHALLHKTFLVT